MNQRDCMIKAAVEFGALTAGLCDPPDPRVAEASKTCIRSACTVREALSSQREIQTACGVEPTVVKTYIPVMSTLFGIATVAVAMRFANRYTVTGKFWWDDGFLALTWMGAVALTALTFEAKDHGFGSEMWAVDFEDMDHLLATAYASQLVFIVCRLMLRHSIILFYLRIFSIGSLRPLIIVGTMVFNTVFSLVIGLLLTFQCRPISFFWMQWDGNNLGKCISVDGLNFGGGAVGILTDVWVLLLPLPYVARLQLSLQKRVGVSFMLAAGVSVVTFTVLKVIAAKKISTSENTPTVMAEISLWTGLEIYAGIIAACLPGIRSFVTHFLHRVGLTSAPGSVVRSHQGHISLGHNAGSRSDNQKKNKTISSFQGSRSSQANIRITTMIHTQQHDGLPSDTYLPLHVMDGLNANNQTGVRAHAWA
ncbi:hypothetical protein QBC38DRAFT_376967 [Podospora fimiseda]|uniref:Rhodopsin domain-containing protein n=1 Tax=Podospora fimiseda TaxID=252190 RepID=A0AAN6YMK7_9PEZI|nr:hypothetical protein QBC38DRAFT_376967 [Podospora fimiseda]